ncbi:TonB family protein [Bacteroidota bacterium]
MNEIFLYLAKVSVAIALLSVPYYFLLRNDPQLLIKRIYLAGGLVLAWIFPLISLAKPEITAGLEPVFFIDPQAATSSSDVIATSPELSKSSTNFNSVMLLGFIYLAGLFLLFIKNLIVFRRNKKGYIKGDSGYADVVFTTQNQVFTLFHKIFLPEKYANTPQIESILIHERAHMRQLHLIDLLISEFTLLLTWFNPFSWLISRMIKENHEHLADRSVLRQGVNPAHYKALLLNHAMGGEVIRLGHRFNQSLTKKRFNMMKTIKAQKKGIVKYAFILPLIMAVTLYATAGAQQPSTVTGKVYLVNETDPAIGASVIEKGTTNGTVVDRDGSFTLEVEGNPQIAISFVGYKTATPYANDLKKNPVILQPMTYTLDIPERLVMPNEASVIVKLGDLKNQDIIFIVDGEPIKSIDHISKDDIETISVLKNPDDPLIKKYNAPNGLVEITTKKAATSESAKGSESEEVFYIVEDMAKFPGGMKAMAEYIFKEVKPTVESGLTGTVMVQFTIRADGSLTDITVVNSTNDKLDDKAVDIIKNMPEWNPGKQRGKPVLMKVQLPVRFLNIQQPPAK